MRQDGRNMLISFWKIWVFQVAEVVEIGLPGLSRPSI